MLKNAYSPCPNELWTSTQQHIQEECDLFTSAQLVNKSTPILWIPDKTRDRIYSNVKQKGNLCTEEHCLLLKKEVQRKAARTGKAVLCHGPHPIFQPIIRKPHARINLFRKEKLKIINYKFIPYATILSQINRKMRPTSSKKYCRFTKKNANFIHGQNRTISMTKKKIKTYHLTFFNF